MSRLHKNCNGGHNLWLSLILMKFMTFWVSQSVTNCPKVTTTSLNIWFLSHNYLLSRLMGRRLPWKPKGSKMVNLVVFDKLDPFEPIWTLLDHFRQKSICCPIRTKQGLTEVLLSRKSFLVGLKQRFLFGTDNTAFWLPIYYLENDYCLTI